jgi:hypothetical protein
MKTKLIAIIAILFMPFTVMAADPSPTPPPDKLQVALADMVNKSVQVAGDAKDFLVGQLPDVIQQLLLWKFFEHLIPMIVALLVALVIARWAYKRSGDLEITTVPPPNEHYRTISAQVAKNGWPRFVYACVVTLMSVISWGVFLNMANLKWLQIWVAPKVYLIEYAKTMITGH